MGLVLELESFHYPGGPELFAPARLELSEGKMVALVGGSGCGKSSLLTLLAGLHPQPLGGRFRGRTAVDPNATLGYLGSDPEAFLTGFCTTVLEEVGWSLFGWGWSAEQVRQRVDQTMQELELGDLLWRNPQELSGGQQQMVALAAVWARQPRYLLLDEPASRLDPRARRRLQETVAGLAAEHGVGVLWATANLGEVTWCQTVWSIEAESAAAAPFGLQVTPAGEWDPGKTASVPPWPVEWSRRWGKEPLPWTAALVETGPLPTILAPSAPPAIETRGLAYRPSGFEGDLFDGLDWQVRKGECLALIGVNGAGKTTLARLIKGLLRPQGGSVLVAGVDIAGQPLSKLASTVAYTFQEPANLFMRTRVDAELLYSGQLLGLDRQEATDRAQQAMLLFGLTAYAAAHPRELPAAALGLLGVALSWYSRAQVQILDEPLARLDRPARAVLERVIESWRAEGTTVVLIAHDLDWLCTVCSTFTALDGGKVLAHGSPAEVFSSPLIRVKLGVPMPLVGS